MHTAPCDESTGPKKTVSLRSNFAWTFAGNAVYAACQWAVLSLIAKLGSSEMLGQYALAVAVCLPPAMLSHLNLRAVLATDVEQRHPFGDYLAVRLGTTLLGMAAIAGIALVSGYPPVVALAIVLVGASYASENVSDIYYGVLQRRERMDQVAKSMIARGVLSASALGAVLWLTGDLILSVAALVTARLTVLGVYDRPKGSAGENLSRTSFGVQAAIVRTALPLGVVLMLVTLTSTLPRYVIESKLGTGELGAFAAVVSFITVGSTVINALGQSATPRLARFYSSRELAGFHRLAFKLTGLAVLLGLAGVAAAALLGRFVLGVIYRPEYSAHSGLLVSVMGAAIFIYVAIMLGYVITSTRSFKAQMPLLSVVAATSGFASWVFVPAMGLRGAAVAMAAAGFLQIIGELFILRRAVRGLEPAA